MFYCMFYFTCDRSFNRPRGWLADDDDDDVIDDSMYNVARDDDDDHLMSSCFRESLNVDCGPRHRIRVVTDWASSSSSSSSRVGDEDSDRRRAEGSCSVDARHCVVVAARHADIARQFCVGRRSCDGLRVTSRPCPSLRPVDYQLLVFICVPGIANLLILSWRFSLNKLIFLFFSSIMRLLPDVFIRLYHVHWSLLEMLKLNKALDENSSLSYGTSPVIWDHTVLPATRHKFVKFDFRSVCSMYCVVYSSLSVGCVVI